MEGCRHRPMHRSMPPPYSLFVHQSLCSSVSGLRAAGPGRALLWTSLPGWAFGSHLTPPRPRQPAGHPSSPLSEGSFHLPRKAAALERPVPEIQPTRTLQKGKLRNIRRESGHIQVTQQKKQQTKGIRGSAARSQEATGEGQDSSARGQALKALYSLTYLPSLPCVCMGPRPLSNPRKT